jgi:hypothetical protein
MSREVCNGVEVRSSHMYVCINASVIIWCITLSEEEGVVSGLPLASIDCLSFTPPPACPARSRTRRWAMVAARSPRSTCSRKAASSLENNSTSTRFVDMNQRPQSVQDCTFFTRKDILRLYKRFYALNPVKVPTNMQGNRPAIVTLCYEEVEKMPELRVCDQCNVRHPHCRRTPFVVGSARSSQRTGPAISHLTTSSICSQSSVRWLPFNSN